MHQLPIISLYKVIIPLEQTPGKQKVFEFALRGIIYYANLFNRCLNSYLLFLYKDYTKRTHPMARKYSIRSRRNSSVVSVYSARHVKQKNSVAPRFIIFLWTPISSRVNSLPHFLQRGPCIFGTAGFSVIFLQEFRGIFCSRGD